MLVDIIKQDMITAWKNKDILKKDTLSFLLSKIKNRGIELKVETVPDAEVLAIIQKMIKELQDEGDNFIKAGRSDKAAEIYKQGLFISTYLPKQLTEAEIKEIITKQGLIGVPDIMKYFKANYAGQVSMALVNSIARNL